MECFWVLGTRFSRHQRDDRWSLLLLPCLIPAGPPGPPPHIHRDADEFFFVVEGRVDVLFDDA
jgi:mannose-6-phosphate isomerase-like protein (cupin superfamily)